MRRSARAEYFFAALLLLIYEQFVFHQWRIYDYREQRVHDYGLYEHSNIPLTRHNGKLYTMYRTEVNFTDFARFVEVDVNDVVRDKLKKGYQPTQYDLHNQATLSKIDNTTVFTRA